MKKTILLLIASAITLVCSAQGINFTKGSFAEIMKQAEDQNKTVFVDVYADWCGPCKVMDKQVFSLEEVGDYFNQKFICYKLDAENPENKEIMEKYNLQKLPTFMVLNPKGEQIATHSGVMDAYALVRMGKTAMNEQPTPQELYKAYERDKNNPDKMKAVLMDAPFFIQSIQGESQQKRWGLRVSDLFEKYIKTKGLENMSNPDDFRIISTYHVAMSDDDKIVDDLVKYYNEYAKTIDPQALSGYISHLHLSYINDLARNGKQAYLRECSRINGDMNNVYMILYPDVEGFYQTYKEFADATYYIFHEKNSVKYIESMERYFKYLPDLNYNDYALAIENLINGLNEKLDKPAAEKILLWVDEAKTKEYTQESEISLNMVSGDCYATLGQKAKAKEMYDKSFTLLMKSQNQNFVSSMQQILKKRLAKLDE